MQDRSNVRCYLPKHEAAKLLTVIEQIQTDGRQVSAELINLVASKDRPA